jgi:hypothetical protein
MYYIYHIPGIKIGCSSQPEQRVADQNFVDFEILESHEDIYVASDREQKLQRQYGYRVDTSPYWSSVQNRFKFPQEMQKELTKRVKNRFKFNSETARTAGLLGTKVAWTERKERMLEAAKENVKAATAAAATSPNRASLQVYYCVECNREITGCGAAGQHRKKQRHNVNKKI